MNNAEQTSTPSQAETQGREWVTPTFEQIALRDALGNAAGVGGAVDGNASSS